MAVALMFWHIPDQLESIYNSNALVIAFGNVKPLAQFAYDCLYIHVFVRASHWTDPVFVRESTYMKKLSTSVSSSFVSGVWGD